MDSLPPPQFPPSGPVTEPTAEAGRSRLMIGGVAALAAVLVAGGLVVGSQFVSADRPSIATSSAAIAPGDDPGDGEEADWTGFDRCLGEQLGIDLSADGKDDDLDADDEQVEAAEQACADLLPIDVKAEFDAFEAYGQCVDEQLGGVFGDLLGEDGKPLDDVWNGSVVVENLGGDGDEKLSVYDFGEGDGTVVVTKSGDTLTVETSGDVTTLDHSFFEAEKDAWEAAEQACANLLPAGLDVFDMEFGDLGKMLGELPFDEGMFDQFDEGLFDEFSFDEGMFDDELLAEVKEMLESGDFGDLGQLFEDLVDVPAGADEAD